MTSERNAKKSTGPRTAVGKRHSSLNALRHGLAGVRHHNPVVAPRGASMAETLCGRSEDPLLYEQALRIAENEYVLRDIREQRISAIERMRDSTAVPALEAQPRVGRSQDASEGEGPGDDPSIQRIARNRERSLLHHRSC